MICFRIETSCGEIATLFATTAAPIGAVVLVAARHRTTAPMRNAGLTTSSLFRHFASGAAVIFNCRVN